MGDSVQLLENGYRRSVGTTRPGRLHKGHGVVAANSSIPSKYQTLVTSNADRRGFGATPKRFNHDATVSENPGPGSYKDKRHAERHSTSFSKKGMGVGFVSKTRRVPRHKGTAGPGSAAYALPSMLSTRRDYNSSTTTSSFHSPIAVQRDKVAKAPAPNSYQVSDRLLHKNNGSQFQASFKSTSRRVDFNRNHSSAPAPGHYNINDSQVRDSVKVPHGVFKSSTERQMTRTPPSNPGPGHYKPHEPVPEPNRTLMPRKHYLCISAPAMPLPPPLPEPGPGSYELVNYKGPAKHYMSSAAFVSSTSRWNGTGEIQAPGTDNPGPATYRPDHTNGKQSFLYNAQRKWVH